MIYDAQTNPRGMKLSISAWPRDSRIMAIAGLQGYRIPAPTFTAPEATPARALLNHGVWRAWCPDCAFAAEDVWRGHAVFWCMRCGNLKAGRAWRPLIWPENWQQIEADLDPFPTQAQNWEPWGVAVDHVAVAEEWVEHAGLMIDPEHGLTDNEVGGEDDPETYTVPVLAVTNAIIASSDANVDKGDIRYFRQFMSANPAGSGYWLQSSGTSAASWVARATALAAALAEITSANVGGSLTFTDNQEGIALHSGGFLRDINTTGTYLNTNGSAFYVQTEDGVTTIFRAISGDPGPYFMGNEVWHDGNTTNKITQAKMADDSVGTAELIADSVTTSELANDAVEAANIKDLNVTAAKLAVGAAASNLGYTPARINAGTYTGNGAHDRQIACGFVPKWVKIQKDTGGTYPIMAWEIYSSTTNKASTIARTSLASSTALIGEAVDLRFHASDGFYVSDFGLENVSGETYRWVAFG